MKNKSIIVLIAGTIIFGFTACKKQSLPKCQKWEIEDESSNIGGCPGFGCGGRTTLQLTFCGDALNDAKAGNTIILGQDSCCKRTRTFVKLIQ